MPRVSKVGIVVSSGLNPHVVKSMTSNNSLRKVVTQLNEVELSASERGSISIIVSKEVKVLGELVHERCNGV